MPSIRERLTTMRRNSFEYIAKSATGSFQSRESVRRESSRRRSSRRASGRENSSSSKKRKNSLFFKFGKNKVEDDVAAVDDYDDYIEEGKDGEDSSMHASEYYFQEWMTPEELKDREFDRARRRKFVEEIEDEVQEYSDKEIDFIDEKFEFISDEDNFKWERIKDPKSKNPKWKLHDEKDPICYAKCIGTIAATPEELLAWYWHFDSHQNMRKHIDQNGDDDENFPNRCEKLFNNHHHVLYACRKMPFPLSPRDFLSRGMWRRISRNKYILCYHYDEPDDVGHDIKYSKLKKLVRAEYTGIYLFERMSEDRTRMVYVSKVDVKGRVPAMVANSGLKGLVETVNRATEYFDEELELLAGRNPGESKEDDDDDDEGESKSNRK